MSYKKAASINKILNIIWKSDVARINNHLPKEFKTLAELLSTPDPPQIKARDNSSIYIDKLELTKIAAAVPQSLHTKLRLPIILVRRLDLGRGVFQLVGDKPEAFLLLKFLGYKKSLNEITLPLYLYRPQIFELKKKLRSSIIIAFAFSNKL